MKPILYVCRYCNEVHSINSFWKWFFTPHFGAKKYMRCKNCGKLHAMSRVDGKKIWDLPF